MRATRRLLTVFCLCALAHAQTPSPDQVYSFDPKVVHPPVPIWTAEADMPDQARRQQLDGFCTIALVVDKKGLPQNARVLRCSDPIFADSSLAVVKNYRFKPATTVQENKTVLFKMNIEVSYRFGPNRGPISLPRPHIKLDFLLPSQPARPEPDSAGTYTLSHVFDPPNALPRLQRFVGVGFGRTAFSLDDGAGCIAAIDIDETGQPTDVKITECDDPSLEEPARRSLLRSQFFPAILNGKAVPVRASVHLACDGFEAPTGP